MKTFPTFAFIINTLYFQNLEERDKKNFTARETLHREQRYVLRFKFVKHRRKRFHD